MACRGVLFAVTDEQTTRLLAASTDEEVLEIVEDIEEGWDEDFLVQTDKAWDAIHRCLSDGTLKFSGGTYPLNRCILGGKQLYQGDDYIISFVPANEVKDVAAALAELCKDPDQFHAWVTVRLTALKQTDFPQEYLDDESFKMMHEYVSDYLDGILWLYQQATEANRAVIFTVDQ